MRTILMYIYFLTCVVCQLMAGNDVPESNISFKGIVEIKGTPISFNYRYQPVTQEVGIVFHNGFLIYKNSNEPLRALDVREKKIFVELGAWGDYPAKFFNPHICLPKSDSILCYIEDEGFIYNVYNNGEVEKTKQRSYSWNHEMGGNRVAIIKNFVDMTEGVWLFAGKSSKGQSLYITENKSKESETSELLPLFLDTDIADWSLYLGNLVARKDRKKAVYAYTYYNRLQFIDLEKKTSHIVKQPGKGYDYNTLNQADVDQLNLLYYRYCYPGEKYVYFLNLGGRFFKEIQKDNKSGDTYVYIEQFDWEGNPIRKIKLDKFGYFFCVDEENGKLYLVEKKEKGAPFYEYDIFSGVEAIRMTK